MNKFVSNQETLEEAVDDLKLEIKEKVGNSIQNRNSKFEMNETESSHRINAQLSTRSTTSHLSSNSLRITSSLFEEIYLLHGISTQPELKQDEL